MSHTSRDEWEKCEESRKGPEYKEMHYLTFAPVTELEHFIFEKCSFDQLISTKKPHVLVAKLFTIFTYKDLLRVLHY